MHTLLFVFEFLGTTELLVIALVALIIFGPRKLPEIGRMVGKSIAEFKRASDDFKRTWEFEVELDQRKHASGGDEAAPNDAVPSAGGDGMAEATPAALGAGEFSAPAEQPDIAGETVARTPATQHPEGGAGEPAGAGAWEAADVRAGSSAPREGEGEAKAS